MDFSLRRIENQNMHYTESDQKSRMQLVFLPGGFNPELWKHQLRYFSRSFKTASFRPTKSNRNFEGEKEALKNILNQERFENTVLVSNLTSGPIAQHFESREDVLGTVLTGLSGSLLRPPRKIYRLFWILSTREPKLMRKFLFDNSTKYKVVKEFVEDLQAPRYSDFRSFTANYGIKPPAKNSMIVFPEKDSFSSLEKAQEMGRSASTSLIERAGTFPFYEKPQEYNKALNDFLEHLEQNLEEEQVIKAKSKNRSLFEFEKKNHRRKIEVRQ